MAPRFLFYGILKDFGNIIPFFDIMSRYWKYISNFGRPVSATSIDELNPAGNLSFYRFSKRTRRPMVKDGMGFIARRNLIQSFRSEFCFFSRVLRRENPSARPFTRLLGSRRNLELASSKFSEAPIAALFR